MGKIKILQVSNAKLLGMVIDDDLTWNTHIIGKGGVLSSLNSRLFLVKRLNKCVRKAALQKIADSIKHSKSLNSAKKQIRENVKTLPI